MRGRGKITLVVEQHFTGVPFGTTERFELNLDDVFMDIRDRRDEEGWGNYVDIRVLPEERGN